eukprot:3677902-Karenia_brevis.AAC.2
MARGHQDVSSVHLRACARACACACVGTWLHVHMRANAAEKISVAFCAQTMCLCLAVASFRDLFKQTIAKALATLKVGNRVLKKTQLCGNT